jgi:hypothetical protein
MHPTGLRAAQLERFYTFSHPRRVTRADHHNAAWRDPHIGSGSTFEVRETTSRGTKPLGHVLIAWKTHMSVSALRCGGASCQLEAQQL